MAHDSHSGHHIVSQRVLITVFASLVALTVLTVITAQFVDIGVLNLPLALSIAGLKAMLVVTFFMALKYDNPMNSLILGIGVICVTVFLVFTLFDTAFRGDMPNVDSQTISDTEGRNLNQEAREAREESAGAQH
ncbi:MAG: oxidase [Rhodothermales bacterium]|nr:oxidase [Rhodothermales bacterium]